MLWIFMSTFGNINVGSVATVNDPDAQYVSYFTSLYTGTVTDVFAYIAGASVGNCRVALYSITGGVADVLLGQSDSVAIDTALSWVNFKLPSVPVTSGVVYGLALLSDVSVQVTLVAGTGIRGYGSGSYVAGFANPFGTVWWSDPTYGAMSIYAQVTTDPINTNHTIIVPASVVANGVTYNFVQWEDGSTNTTRTVNLITDMTITATYQITAVSLTVASGANGSVLPSGTYQLDIGASYQFVATPNSGYNFDHWMLGTTNYGTSSTLTITATANMNAQTLTAIFSAIPQRTLIVSASSNGSTNPTTGTYNYTLGSTIPILATPINGYKFDYWTLDGVNAGASNPIYVTMDANHTITPFYVQLTKILIIASSAGGTTNPAPNSYAVNEGQSVLITAIQNENYRFSYWLLDGTQLTANPTSVLMTTDHSLTAVFVYYTPPPKVATIKGVVTDAIGPVEGASVTITGYAAVTLADGTYELANLPLGVYSISIQKQGYTQKTIAVDASAEGTYFVNVVLTPTSPPPNNAALYTILITTASVVGAIILRS